MNEVLKLTQAQCRHLAVLLHAECANSKFELLPQGITLIAFSSGRNGASFVLFRLTAQTFGYVSHTQAIAKAIELGVQK